MAHDLAARRPRVTPEEHVPTEAMERFDEAMYAVTLDSLTAVCRALLTLPVEEARQANEHFQAIAPILDPTAFMRGGANNLREQRIILDAAVRLKQACLSIKPR